MQNESENNFFQMRMIGRVLTKALILFVFANLLIAMVSPLSALGRISAYNKVFPGRERFPFGENPTEAYNFSLYSFDAMYASHRVANGEKPLDEFRVMLIGDSSTWGTLLKTEETLAGQLNEKGLQTTDGRSVKFYNLGYPTLSLFKDVMVLERAMNYQPDLILWLVTLDSFPIEKQLVSPIVANNAEEAQKLMDKYDLKFDAPIEIPRFWDKTIIGQRRGIADLARLQLYGVMWAATGIDQVYPEDYPPAQRDLEPDVSFYDRQPSTLDVDSLAMDVLGAGMEAAGDVPVLLVNEPILVSDGENSDVRYNYYYPRWAYDQYRQILFEQANNYEWQYLDVWDLVSEKEFTNSAIHRTPTGEGVFAEVLIEKMITEYEVVIK